MDSFTYPKLGELRKCLQSHAAAISQLCNRCKANQKCQVVEQSSTSKRKIAKYKKEHLGFGLPLEISAAVIASWKSLYANRLMESKQSSLDFLLRRKQAHTFHLQDVLRFFGEVCACFDDSPNLSGLSGLSSSPKDGDGVSIWQQELDDHRCRVIIALSPPGAQECCGYDFMLEYLPTDLLEDLFRDEPVQIGTHKFKFFRMLSECNDGGLFLELHFLRTV